MDGSDMDEILKALGDPTRLQIIKMLAEHGEVCVCKIVDELKINQPTVSHHMAKLKQAGLLNVRKESQWIHYSLKAEVIKNGPLAFLAEIVTLAERSAAKVNDTKCCV
jgi:ArsR family transcriptional regulator